MTWSPELARSVTSVNSGLPGNPSTDAEVLESLRWLAMPVAVVGAAVDDHRTCATGTLSYVSTRPATVVTPLARSSSAYQLAHSSGMFSLSLLRDDQAKVAVLAARHHSSGDKFTVLGLAIESWFNVPALADCGTILWCELTGEVASGNQVVCVGTVKKVSTPAQGSRPLLRSEGAYRSLGAAIDVADESPYPL